MICRNTRCRAALPDDYAFCPLCGWKQTVERKARSRRPNGTGTVYRLSGGRTRPWVAKKDGVVLGYYQDRKTATEALERSQGRTLTEKINMTFAEVFTDWYAEAVRDVGDKSVEGYNVARAHFSDLDGRKFRELRTKDFQACVDAAAQSRSMAAKMKMLVNQMSIYAVREEITVANHAQYVKITQPAPKEKQIFSDDEIERIKKDGSDAAAVVLMMIYTGMRIGELFAARIADYHGTYLIGGEKTDAGKNRVIPIPPVAAPYFERFAATATVRLLDGVFGPDTGNFRSRQYKTLLERCGVPYKAPHCCRHTYASQAVKAKAQPEALQKILGHAHYSTTAEVYVHADIEALCKAAAAIWR